MITNGTLLTEDILSQINKDVSFAISADGITNSTTREVSFNELKDKFLLLKNNGFRVRCWYCPTKLNLDDIPIITKWCIDHDIMIIDNILLPIGRAKDNEELQLQMSEYQKISNVL